MRTSLPAGAEFVGDDWFWLPGESRNRVAVLTRRFLAVASPLDVVKRVRQLGPPRRPRLARRLERGVLPEDLLFQLPHRRRLAEGRTCPNLSFAASVAQGRPPACPATGEDA